MAYPEWVIKAKRSGTVVQKVGGDYFLYSTRSRRVKDKPYPISERKYFGKITEDGVLVNTEINIDRPFAAVYEYGFSYAVRKLLPDEFGYKCVGEEEAHRRVRSVIARFSPESYLLEEGGLSEAKDNQISQFQVKMEGVMGIAIEKLLPLRSIYLIDLGEHRIISRISAEQSALLSSIGVGIP